MLRFTRVAESGFSGEFKDKILHVYSLFPELQDNEITCGFIRKGSHLLGTARGWASPKQIALQPNVGRMTIAHELTHLLQGNGVPHGEKACDIWALARLPQPNMRAVDLSSLVERTARLETRQTIHVQPGVPVEVDADPDQIEQLLINLMRNAVDAALETGGGVRVGWHQNSHRVSVCIEDDGPGLANQSNLFVPFFTTKPQGSGIGLVLGRQIAEAHGGTLTLEARQGRRRSCNPLGIAS